MLATNSFKKSQRISSEETIQALFKNGLSFFEFPFKIFYNLNLETPVQGRLEMAISVPKKKTKKAVDRNRVKRITREAFRLNKSTLFSVLNEKDAKLSVFFVFVGTHNQDQSVIPRKINLILSRLEQITADYSIL